MEQEETDPEEEGEGEEEEADESAAAAGDDAGRLWVELSRTERAIKTKIKNRAKLVGEIEALKAKRTELLAAYEKACGG